MKHNPYMTSLTCAGSAKVGIFNKGQLRINSCLMHEIFSVSRWKTANCCHIKFIVTYQNIGRGSSIGSEFAWHASGPEFDPHAQHILSWRLGHENISTAILPLPLIQEEQLSVTGERMCTKY